MSENSGMTDGLSDELRKIEKEAIRIVVIDDGSVELLFDVRQRLRDAAIEVDRLTAEVLRLQAERDAMAKDVAPDWLRAVGELICTQDNRITADPIFIVQQKRTYAADADYDHARIVWLCDEHVEATTEEAAALEAQFAEDGDDRPKGWRRVAARLRRIRRRPHGVVARNASGRQRTARSTAEGWRAWLTSN